MKTILTIVVAVGFFLRIFLSISTYHQDLGAISLAGKYLVVDNQWLNFYDQSTKDASKTIFNYQPLAYLIPAISYLPFTGLVKHNGDNFVNSDWAKNYSGSINLNLLIYKLPMILADLGCLFLLSKIIADKKQKFLALILWSLNPIAIFVSSVLGQVDIFIALFLLTAFYFQQKGKGNLAVLFVSLSALVKPIGLVLLPFFIAPGQNSIKSLLSSTSKLLLGFTIYILGILPFIHSAAYRHYALFADQIGKSTFAGINISAGTTIPYFFIFLALAYFLYINQKRSFTESIVLCLLSSLVFTNFHPQWLVWVMPFLVILFASQNSTYQILFTFLSWILVLFSFDSSLHLGIFIGSTVSLPSSVTTSEMYKNLTLLGRAILVAQFIWILTYPSKTKT